MKKTLLFFLLILVINLQAQQTPIQLLPEFSTGQPTGAFNEDTFHTENGFGAGLHMEKHNIWKVFGLGLYGGYHSYDTAFITNFPNQVNDATFQSRIFVEGTDFNWESLQLAIGPTINIKLADKLQLQGFSKAGISQISYPEYRYFVDVTSPSQEQFTLFDANTPSDAQSDYNFMMISGLRFNYTFSKTFGLSVGANFTHIKGLTHTYTTRNLTIFGNEEPGILYESLLNTPEQTKTYECNINSVNGTIGIVINLGGGTKPPQEELPESPEPLETPDDTYNCEGLVYEAPGYNDYVILSQRPYAIFEWTDENARNLTGDKNYELLFYIKENGEYKEVDSRIMNTKRRFKIGLNATKAYPDNALFWKIRTVNNEDERFCPESSKLMRLLVFQNPEEAIEKLPECLMQTDENKPTDTNFFRKQKQD